MANLGAWDYAGMITLGAAAQLLVYWIAFGIASCVAIVRTTVSDA